MFIIKVRGLNLKKRNPREPNLQSCDGVSDGARSALGLGSTDPQEGRRCVADCQAGEVEEGGGCGGLHTQAVGLSSTVLIPYRSGQFDW